MQAVATSMPATWKARPATSQPGASLRRRRVLFELPIKGCWADSCHVTSGQVTVTWRTAAALAAARNGCSDKIMIHLWHVVSADIVRRDVHRSKLRCDCRPSQRTHVNPQCAVLSRGVGACPQGPMQNTAADFWAMVYSQKCGLVLMLTRHREGHGMVKVCSLLAHQQHHPV